MSEYNNNDHNGRIERRRVIGPPRRTRTSRILYGPDLIEVVNGATCVINALFLLQADGLFLEQSPGHRWLLLLASEGAWATIFLFTGIFALSAWFQNIWLARKIMTGWILVLFAALWIGITLNSSLIAIALTFSTHIVLPVAAYVRLGSWRTHGVWYGR